MTNVPPPLPGQQPPPLPQYRPQQPPPFPQPQYQQQPPPMQQQHQSPPMQQPVQQQPPRQNLQRQTTELTRTYPCPTCGSQFVFNIRAQKLVCPSCGNSAEIIENTGRSVVEHDFHSSMAQFRALAGSQRAPATTGEHEVVCQNCGGHTTFTGTLTATRCPYCATPIQRDDVHEAPARLPVDGVLPFQVDERSARELVEKWVTKRWFTPNEFKKYKQTGSFNSVYAAYFTYDAETSSNYSGQRGEDYTVTVRDGDQERTEVRTNWYPVSGQVDNSFDDVAVFANDGFDRKHINALEPWPTGDARPFSGEYIAGHLCRTYDRDAAETLPEAQQRMNAQIESSVRSAIGGDRQQVNNISTNWRALAYKHLLLPIWLLTVIYEQRPFQVCINGITGEVQGQRPWSKVKIIAAVIAAIVVIVLVLMLLSALKHGHSTTVRRR